MRRSQASSARGWKAATTQALTAHNITHDRHQAPSTQHPSTPSPQPLSPQPSARPGLALLSLASKVIKEPVRAVPLVAWGLYCSIVFFSNGILPGPDATQLDMATWVEARHTLSTLPAAPPP